jgi:hypothetical protein
MERIEMDEFGMHDPDRPDRGPQGANADGKAYPGIDPDVATLHIESGLESGRTELRDIVLQLSSRLARAEGQLMRLGRAGDLLSRRVDDAASRLNELAGRSREHADAIHMICSILKDLDDPYGFGASLDEWLAYESPERTQEDE